MDFFTGCQANLAPLFSQSLMKLPIVTPNRKWVVIMSLPLELVSCEPGSGHLLLLQKHCNIIQEMSDFCLLHQH